MAIARLDTAIGLIGVLIGAMAVVTGSVITAHFGQTTAQLDRQASAAQHLADVRRDAYVAYYDAGETLVATKLSILAGKQPANSLDVADAFLSKTAAVDLVGSATVKRDADKCLGPSHKLSGQAQAPPVPLTQVEDLQGCLNLFVADARADVGSSG